MTPTPSTQRKRRHSNAFAFSRTALATAKAPRSGENSPEFSTPYWLGAGNKENETPLGNGNGGVFKTHVAHQAAAHTHQGPASLTVPVRLSLEDRSIPAFSYPQHHHIREALSSDDRPFTPDFSFRCYPPADTHLGMSTGAEPGYTIYEDEDQDFAMTGTSVGSGPPTPSALGFQDLSLLEIPRRALPMTPVKAMTQGTGASVEILPTSWWSGTFQHIHPNDIIILFAQGKQVVKVPKYPLCASSLFFASLLSGPILEHHTPILRLRLDFPWAIRALIEFLTTKNYTFNPAMRIQHPHISMLDFHIHAYLVGAKYSVPGLCELAIAQYVNIGEMVLSMDIVPRGSGGLSMATAAGGDSARKLHFVSPAKCDDVLQDDERAGAVVVNMFLDSLVLLWRKTAGRGDEMRCAVLEVLVPELGRLLRVPFFTTVMQEVPGFAEDVERVLAEDGFEVRVVKGGEGWRVKFEV